jgi:hypothetical protein
VSDNAAMQHEVSFPKALKIVLMNFSFFSNKHDDAEQKKKKSFNVIDESTVYV